MSITQYIYNQVMMLDDFTCVYCGYRGADITVDHYIPQVRGGSDIVQNLVAACQRCNSSKGGHAPYEVQMLARFGRFAYVQEMLDIVAKPMRLLFAPAILEPATTDADIVRMAEQDMSRNQIAIVLGGNRQRALSRIRQALGGE